jgi:Tfp pilus assembly protein PilF
MGRNQFSTRVRRILAAGLVFCFSGCGSFELAAPHPHVGWTSEGLKERITPAQEADVQIALARVAESQGDIDGAEAAYRQALKRDKKRGDAHLHLANIQTLKGDYRQAEEEYQKALATSPGNADVFCNMGYSFYLQRKWEDAQRNLKQALAIDPNHRRAHNNLAMVYAHMEQTEEALAEFQKAGNSATDAHVNLAFSLSLDQRWQSARQEYRRAMAANPSSDILKARLREIDRLIAVNEVRPPKPVIAVNEVRPPKPVIAVNEVRLPKPVIAVNEVRLPKPDATKDAATIPVAMSPSRPAPQGKPTGTADKATRPKIPRPSTLEPISWGVSDVPSTSLR